MRMPYLTTSFVPKHRSYGEFAKLLKQSRQTELVSYLLNLNDMFLFFLSEINFCYQMANFQF